MSLTQQHDTMFRSVFKRSAEATGLLKDAFGPELSAFVDWSSLCPAAGTFVDALNTQRYADVLFQANVGGTDGVIYVLIEHQSRTDPLMAFRMLRYLVCIWDAWLVEQSKPGQAAPKHLPPVLPVVFSHAIGGWTAAVELRDCFQIRARNLSALGQLTLLLFKHLRGVEDLLQLFEPWWPLFRAVRNTPNGRKDLQLLQEYIVKVASSSFSLHDLAQTFGRELGDEARGDIMTFEEKLLAEGEARGEAKGAARGKAEGKAEGRAEDVLRILLKRRVAMNEAVRARILGCTDLALLDRWFDRALEVEAADAIFENP